MQGVFLRKYGEQAVVDFHLYEVDGVDFRVDAAHAAGDTTIMKDEGAEANTTNGFVDEGNGYSITLTATEMQAARIKIYVIDQTATKVWLDTAIVIETYGHASAQHAIDLDDSVRAGLTALPNAAADAAGGLPISDAGGLDLDTILGRITANVALASVCTEARLAELDAANIPSDLDAVLADTNELQGDWVNGGRLDLLLDQVISDIAALNDLSAAEVNAQVDTALADINLDHLLAVADADDVVNNSVIAKLAASDGDWSGFDNTADSLEAIRDRGDAAWTTGGGGSLTQSLNVQPVIPISIDLANTATVRLGLMLVNALDDLPSTAEITPGTIDIARKAIGGTSWSAVVTGAAMSEQAGMVYYDEVFDGATGYAEGDSIRITFKGVSITADANTHEVCDANGVMFQTVIRETMRGTDSAALASVCTEGRLAELDAANLPSDVDDILADTNELQGDWANGGRLDLLIDDILNRIPAALVSGRMSSDAVAISGSTDAADKLEASAETIETGAAAAGTLSTTQMTTNLTEATDDHYNGRIIIWTSGVLIRQATDITDYDGASKMLTFTAVTEAPSADDTFVIV